MPFEYDNHRNYEPEFTLRQGKTGANCDELLMQGRDALEDGQYCLSYASGCLDKINETVSYIQNALRHHTRFVNDELEKASNSLKRNNEERYEKSDIHDPATWNNLIIGLQHQIYCYEQYYVSCQKLEDCCTSTQRNLPQTHERACWPPTTSRLREVEIPSILEIPSYPTMTVPHDFQHIVAGCALSNIEGIKTPALDISHCAQTLCNLFVAVVECLIRIIESLEEQIRALQRQKQEVEGKISSMYSQLDSLKCRLSSISYPSAPPDGSPPESYEAAASAQAAADAQRSLVLNQIESLNAAIGVMENTIHKIRTEIEKCQQELEQLEEEKRRFDEVKIKCNDADRLMHETISVLDNSRDICTEAVRIALMAQL